MTTVRRQKAKGARFADRGIDVALIQNLFAGRRLQMSWRELAARLWRPVVATAVMWVVVSVLSTSLTAAEGLRGQIATFLLVVGCGVLSYGLVLLGLWRVSRAPAGAERSLVDLARHKLAAISGPQG